MTEVAEKPAPAKIKVAKILPYVPEGFENMGISKYGHVLFEGGNQAEQIICLESNGVKRWLTGLNEFAPEVQKIEDAEKKKAVIHSIREKVAWLERMLGANNIDPKDKDFWEKVQTVHPTKNDKFWAGITINVSNEPVFLDESDPIAFIKLCAIEAGGSSLVAKSLSDAVNAATPKKWYLDRAESASNSKVELKRIKNEAFARLNNLSNDEPNKLWLIVKNLDPNSYQYKKSTPANAVYDWLDNFISGTGIQRSAKQAAIKFNALCEVSNEDLKLQAVINDAIFYQYIKGKVDGLWYHIKTDTRLGHNVADVFEYLKSAQNGKILEAVLTEVENEWKK